MIIDLVNFSRYYPGTEASILFRLQMEKIRVPAFFCITENYDEDELNNYLQNHFQHTTHFTLRLSLSYGNSSKDCIKPTEKEPPLYVNIQKSIITRYADRLFKEAKKFAHEYYPDTEETISAHVIVQEMVPSSAFGELHTVCAVGVLNETVITLGEGHNSDFEERDVPYSIYCHNDTDNILFAHEPEKAKKATKSILCRLLELSERLKKIFKNRALKIKFLANFETNVIDLISVNEIDGLHDSEKEIILDTSGISSYYPGVTLPLYASLAVELSKRIMNNTIKRITNKKSNSENVDGLVEYVNGRLYYNTARLKKIQDILSFYDSIEEYLNRSKRILWKNILRKNSIRDWRRKRSMAIKLNKLMEDNIRKKEEIFHGLKETINSLEHISNIEHADSQQRDLHLHKAVSGLTDCLFISSFNTLYINMKNRQLGRCKPGDKKYNTISQCIENAVKFKDEIRVFHGAIMNYLVSFAKRTGQAFVDMGSFDSADDIFYLGFFEAINLKLYEPNNDARILIQYRKKEIASYRSMPNFTKLHFAEKVVNSQGVIVDYIDAIMEKCHLRGSGTISGHACLPAVICRNGLPENPLDCDTKHIYVVHHIPENIASYNLGGLITEEPAVFVSLMSDMSKCSFPVVSGAEHACTIIKDDDIITLDGIKGEVYVQCIQNIKHK